MNPRSTQRRFRGLRSRKGSILVLSALGILVLIVAAAFSVDIAYMQLTREELHIATDAAAKAAVAKLSQGGSETEAKAAAVACAAANSVGPGPLVINASQITLGKVAYSDTGHWPFTEGGTPKVAAKVDVTMSNNTVSGPVSLFFGKVFGTPYFNPSATSTAAFVRNKVCLCLDRSHSMCFDIPSGQSWYYPPPYGYFGSPNSSNYWRGYKVLPNLAGSRWLTLYSAIDVFLTEVASVPVETRVGLVTWSASLNARDLYSAHKGPKDLANLYSTKINWAASPKVDAATKDLDFTTNFATVRSTITARNSVLMEGSTNMQAGMDKGIALFTDDTDTTPWNRVMILFSDGQWNEGSNPVTTSAVTAKARNITVYTVGLLTDAGNTTLQDIATLTGGRYYRATTAAELQAAFQEIARLLPVILTQ